MGVCGSVCLTRNLPLCGSDAWFGGSLHFTPSVPSSSPSHLFCHLAPPPTACPRHPKTHPPFPPERPVTLILSGNLATPCPPQVKFYTSPLGRIGRSEALSSCPHPGLTALSFDRLSDHDDRWETKEAVPPAPELPQPTPSEETPTQVGWPRLWAGVWGAQGPPSPPPALCSPQLPETPTPAPP